MKPSVIVLFGPTGVGKTSLVDRLFSGRGEVVSADALQVYRNQDIGTAKPEPELLSRIPHHLINILDYTEAFSVADFCRRADAAVADIAGRGLIPVVSGGTAYYLKAWLLGLPGTPEADPEIRRAVEDEWKERDDGQLREAVREVDPVSAERLGARDRYRMLRVLEVHRQTGRALSDFHVPTQTRSDYRVFCIGLRREREELYERINRRVDLMFDNGLAAEVRRLRDAGAMKNDPGMKAIGYREWFGDNNGEPSEERVRELIARNSRRYAKRQMTFFSSLPGVHWYTLGDDSPEPVELSRDIELFLDAAEV